MKRITIVFIISLFTLLLCSYEVPALEDKEYSNSFKVNNLHYKSLVNNHKNHK